MRSKETERGLGEGLGHRLQRLSVATVVIAAILLMTGVAVAQSPWLTAGPPSVDAASEGAIEPVQTRGTSLAEALSDEVAGLPGFPDEVETLDPSEVTAENERMLIASFVAFDGGLIDVVMQRLPHALALDVIDASGTANPFTGPNGEEVVVVDKGHTLQVLATSPDGVMANVIIEHINRADPKSPSVLANISASTATEWAISLIQSLGEEL